jgi:limonene-1,2-epoxide hydrolase
MIMAAKLRISPMIIVTPALIGRALLIFFYFAAFGTARAAESGGTALEPVQVIEAYLRATHSRDFAAAYRLISTEDRKVRDLDRYVRQRGAYSGFTLEAARKLSESVEIKVLQQKTNANRVHALVKFRVPDRKRIASAMLNWDPYRLNSLSTAERSRMLEALDEKQRDGSLAMAEGEERFELIKEGSQWRIFLNWAAGVRIPLRLDLSKTNDLEVSLSRKEVTLQPGEIFEIWLKIKNKTQQAVTARIGHLVEPVTIADYLDFVQCGFLLPVTIPPGTEQEYSGSYLLRGSLPEGVRQLNLTYDFRILK